MTLIHKDNFEAVCLFDDKSVARYKIKHKKGETRGILRNNKI